jgi:lauroyl/myristoyl acyltransferase
MDLILYLAARGLLVLIAILPLTIVARVGRGAGWLVFWVDRRHRRVAHDNLQLAFGHELSAAALRALALENFQRIGESFACAAKTAQMTDEQLKPFVEFAALDDHVREASAQGQNMIFAIGHFGNFELYARGGPCYPGYELATTYRGLAQSGLNRLLLQLRKNSGCRFLERRTEGDAMRQFLSQKHSILGLLVDQHAGQSGLPVPFFGKVCSTNRAPALLALRYNCRLFTAICYRVELAKWRIEYGMEIPVHQQGRPRSLQDIMGDVNRAFENAVRRDPANWFWVHRRWKTKAVNQRPAKNELGTASTSPGA